MGHEKEERHEEHRERLYAECGKFKKCDEYEEAEHREAHERPHDDKKVEEENSMTEKENGEEMKMDGLHLKKRDLWLVAGGALGVVAALGIGKLSGKVRPAAVGAVREGYAFKEWLAGKAEKVKEDVEDIVAEGVHQYHSNLSASADTVKREKNILEKIEKLVDQKLAKMKGEQGEG